VSLASALSYDGYISQLLESFFLPLGLGLVGGCEPVNPLNGSHSFFYFILFLFFFYFIFSCSLFRYLTLRARDGEETKVR
jgi:hypothetical protein